MTPAYVLLGLVAAVTLALIGVVLARRPRTRPLHALAAMFGFLLLAWPVSAAASAQVVLPGLDRLDARVVENLLRMAATYFLFLFTLSALPGPAPQRTAVRSGVPFALAAVGVVVSALAVPPALRDTAAALASGGAGGQGQAAVVLVTLFANLAFGYGYGVALVWVHHNRRHAGPLRAPALVLEVGLALLVGSTLVLITSNILRWAALDPPSALGLGGVALLVAGWGVFALGLVLVGVRVVVSARRSRRRLRELHHGLEPLWNALHEIFPDDAFDVAPPAVRRGRGRSAGDLEWAFHRRVIECRDGLVRLSPFLAGAGDPPSGDELRRALGQARRSGQLPVGTGEARVVAAPDGEGMLADAESMTVLARRLRDGHPAVTDAGR